MLFILVMDVLNSLVNHAAKMNLLQPLAVQGAKHRVSFYADDAVVFLWPSSVDHHTIMLVLQIFGHALGLKTNMTKSSVAPIQTHSMFREGFNSHLQYSVMCFPCTCLGLPLTIRKSTKYDLLPLVDKVADHLPSWKSSLMNRAGRLIMVGVVLTDTTIHYLIALDLPKWVFKAIDRKRRGFLWKGQEQANGGNCLVSWEKIQRPLQYGRLSIHKLKTLSGDLRIKWLWAKKNRQFATLGGLPIQVQQNGRALFGVAVVCILGLGESIKFWKDRWLQGNIMAELAPNLYSLVPKRIIKARTVAQALNNY
jgi:hypothetical protein